MSEKTVLQVQNLSFSYPGTGKRALDNINFSVNSGEFVLLCGSSGSGKTTLAKCLNGIIPHMTNGDMYGDVFVNGINSAEVEIHDLSSEIGMVFQNPEDQIFSIRVDDEVALGVECQGYTHEEIVKRVEFALGKLRINDIRRRLTFSLSGGQRQKVSIASNLAVLPSVIVLDDPTTDLDPISKLEVMDILKELKDEMKNTEPGITFFVIEHELTELMEFVDRVFVMHEGKIVLDGDASLFYTHYDYLDEIGVRIPDHIRLGKYLSDKGYEYGSKDYPVKMNQVMEFTKACLEKGLSFPRIKYKDYTIKSSQIVADVKNLEFSYPTSGLILKNMSFEIFKGEFLAIVGHNGSGKTTVMKNLLGLLKPTSGDIIINGHNTKEIEISKLILDIGYTFQNPDNQLFCNSVREEVEFGLKNNDFPLEEIKLRTEKVLEIVELSHCADSHPFSLSRGERQRLAVATMLVSNPKIIMLDEPTTGLDEKDLQGILKLMQELIDFHDGTLIMVTHDMEIVAKYATRIIVMESGKIILNDNPDVIFKSHAKFLEALKLKPTIIASVSTKLEKEGMPYIPNWTFFEEQVKSIKS